MKQPETPKCIVAAITALREERAPLAARLDAINLAIDNLCRVYGVNGTPQPLPLEPRGIERRKYQRKAAPETGEAGKRRAEILAHLERNPNSLTVSDLRKLTPKMDMKDRSNALSVLRLKGAIARAGNTWVIATKAA